MASAAAPVADDRNPAVVRPSDDISGSGRATKKQRVADTDEEMKADALGTTGKLKVILYYKYADLDPETLVPWMKELCTRLGLSGRVLIGKEGLNGTLAGSDAAIDEYIRVMGEKNEAFRDIDWKSSRAKEDPFPDMFVRTVKEIISTGGIIPPEFELTGKHLPPKDFHSMAQVAADGDPNTIILDVRNTKEYSVGHFQGARRCEMQTFAQYPKFIDDNIDMFRDKNVLMYCTGGIRCEKASAYLNAKGVSKGVFQLKGGIHRYMETFPEGGLFKGKNFVFDKRVAMGSKDEEVVGKCQYCSKPYDELNGGRVCTVCRELVLVCPSCRKDLQELHCEYHFHLKDLYFTFLNRFTAEELKAQKAGLAEAREALLKVRKKSGKVDRNRRRTLQKQINRINKRLEELEGGASLEKAPTAAHHAADAAAAAAAPGTTGEAAAAGESTTVAHPDGRVVCRTCGKEECKDGMCWGFWRTESHAEWKPITA